jgi:PAS domain S-box-containing protein
MTASARRIRQLLSWLGDRDRQLQLALDAADLGTWNWDPSTNELAWSDRCRTLIGVTADEPPSVDTFLKRVHPDDRAAVELAIDSALRNGGSYSIEYRIVLPDGEIRWLHSLGRVHQTGTHGRSFGMSGIVRDVTVAHRASEAALQHDQVLALAHRLQRLHHSERLDLAGLLQREIANNLTTLRDHLAAAGRAATVPEVQAASSAALPLLEQTIERLRWMVFELNPPGIEELGFAGALERVLGDQAGQAGFEYEFTMPESPLPVPPRTLEVLFSVAQEAVINIGRHARATQVQVQVRIADGSIHLHVRDNGVGIPEGAWPRPQCYGLLAASARLAEFGGTLRASGSAGQGTTVEAMIPLTPPRPRNRESPS